MTTSISIRAQAKLNLWLHVMAREESGYHAIETLFHRIELADELLVTVAAAAAERSVSCDRDVGPMRDNLAYRAAESYCAAAEWETGFHIVITKQIPVGGGLGGGSADAAATLLALDAMSPHPQGDVGLERIGRELGADVPYLLTAAPAALAWGRGDRMLKLPALPQRYVALVVPGTGLETAAVYQSLPRTGIENAGQLSEADLGSWRRVAGRARNDLRRSPLVSNRLDIAASLAALHSAEGVIMAEMTGSGAVVFGIFDSEPDAAALELATGCRIVITRTALNVEGVVRLD